MGYARKERELRKDRCVVVEAIIQLLCNFIDDLSNFLQMNGILGLGHGTTDFSQPPIKMKSNILHTVWCIMDHLDSSSIDLANSTGTDEKNINVTVHGCLMQFFWLSPGSLQP